jgi:hypothetical protein
VILVFVFPGYEKDHFCHTRTLAITPVLVIAGYYMAFRNIRKDEKLVKSLDKLR